MPATRARPIVSVMNTDRSANVEQNPGMRRYVIVVVLVPLLCLAAVALINRLVDPYQIFRAEPDGVYDDKPALHANMRLHKAFQVRLQKPDALILGSSKAIQGIPTAHALFEGQRVYNLAMPLASMKELTLLLRHANATTPVKRVVLSLDFLSFNALARTDGPAAGFRPERLLGNEKSASPINDYLSALISLDALRASFEVLMLRNHHRADPSGSGTTEHRALTGRGGRQDAEIRSRLLDGGHRSNTLKIEEFFTSAVYLPSPHRQFSFQNHTEDSLYWFEEFLRTLHENNIAASLFISPSHARLNELIHAADLWDQFELWKRQMLALTLSVARAYDEAPYAMLDFSLPGDITSEPFPEAGDSAYQMRYYYESIHFNQRTGTLVLDRLNNVGVDSTSLATEFGRTMTEDNIDGLLQEIRERQAHFRDEHPDYRQELETIVENR